MAHSPVTISSSTRKGGTGKTSLVFHLAGTSASQGMRTLLIDLDPQASLSQTIFTPTVIENIDPQRTIAAVFDEHLTPDPSRIIHPTKWDKISIAPACNHLGNFNHANLAATDWMQDAVLHLINEVRDYFDIVLIDTPPSLALLTWASFIASTHVLSPVQPEDFSAQGIRWITKFCADASKRNPQLLWLGLVVSMQQRIAVHQAYEQTLRTIYNDMVFDTTITASTTYKEAVAMKTPVAYYKPRSAPAKQMKALLHEIMQRTQSPAVKRKVS